MYRCWNLALLILLLLDWPNARAAEDAPPATAPVITEQQLYAGRIRFVPPAGWNVKEQGADGLSVVYSSQDHRSLIAIIVSPQEVVLDKVAAQKMALMIGKKIRDDAKAGHVEILSEPKVEKDDRFLLTIHDRTKNSEMTIDRKHIYRTMGLSLVAAISMAGTDTMDQAQPIHETAERLLATATMHDGARKLTPGETKASSITLPNAGVIVTPPPGWTAQPQDLPSPDVANGSVVATLHPPRGDTRVILVWVVPIPAKVAPYKMLDGINSIAEEQILEIAKLKAPVTKAGTEPIRRDEIISDSRFLRKSRTAYEVMPEASDKTAKPARLVITNREISTGSSIISVTSICPPDTADATETLADAAIVQIQQIKR